MGPLDILFFTSGTFFFRRKAVLRLAFLFVLRDVEGKLWLVNLDAH